MSRRNMHGKVGVKFKAGWTTAKNKSMLRNVVSELIVYGRVKVTHKTAKELVSLADRLVTYAKKGDLHSRRLAAKYVRPIIADKKTGQTALQKLFDEVAPRYIDRNGGYTRILKLDNREGDNAPIALVELV
jgi:large subunit ribosomal protein L17